MSLNAYQAALSRAETPRATEHRLISEITGEMMEAEAKGLKGAMVMPILHRNREMWAAFSSDCSMDGNGLPMELRASIISLGLWVERFTSDVVSGREPIGELIAVNRLVLDGLRTQRMAA